MTASTSADGSRIRERARHLGPELRRPMVLDAALAVWLEHGSEGVTMNAIAEAAGVTKPVVYECFDSKSDVLIHLFTREESRLVDAANAAIPDDIDPDDLPATITAAYMAFFSAALASPASWQLVYEGQSTVPPELADRANAARQAVTDRIQRTVTSDGRYDVDDREARVMAAHLVSLAEAGARLLLDQDADDPEWTPQELAAFVTRRVLRGWA